MSEDDVQQSQQLQQLHRAEPVEPAKRMLSGVELKQLASDGGFTVDETTGDRMIRALDDIIDTLNVRWSALEKLGASPRLSTTATAQWVAQHTVNTAADERGLLTQLQRAREELPQYVEAIREAKRRYADAETGTRSTLENFHRS